MKVGSIVFTTHQGLGYLARDFFNHGVVNDVMILAHGRREDHFDWYPPGTEHLPIHYGPRSVEAFREWVKKSGITHMLFFETPFNWEFIAECRDLKVKTAIMPMHECMPAMLLDTPDLWLCPSELDVQWSMLWPLAGRVHIPVPVPDDVPFGQRERARVFVHNAGNGGLLGRNGTGELLQAIQFLKSDAKLIVRAQEPNILEAFAEHVDSGKVTLVPHHVSFNELWSTGDVFLFPEKFNGLSLPLQEARASGMLVMATNRFPMNLWLPTEPLIPTLGTRRARCAGRLAEFDEAIIDPRNIAEKIDFWFDSDITAYSQSALEWRKSMSWEVLKPKYLEALEAL